MTKLEQVARALCREAHGSCVCDQASKVVSGCADKVRFARAAVAALRDSYDAYGDPITFVEMIDTILNEEAA